MRKGTSIIFVNSQEEILLLLRDNIQQIPYPNMWDLPGGAVEGEETPEEAIMREMKEEINLDLKEFSPLCVTEFSDRIEHTYWKSIDLEIESIILNEGQMLKWFSEKEVGRTELAFGFNIITDFFFTRRPFKG